MSHSQILKDTSVVFSCYAPNARQVAVAGDFNGWQLWGMQPGENGYWGIRTPALGNREIQYRFVVDGNYINDRVNLRTDPGKHENSWFDLTGNSGSLYHRSFYSESLGSYKKYVVYLPPSYGLSDESYPVLYLMGGLLDYEMDWTNKGEIHLVADSLIAVGEMQEMIIVMPDKDQSWTESDQEHLFYRYMTQDLMGHIESAFRVNPAKGRALEGLSIGAHWAMRIGFLHPYSFSSLSSLSCPLSKDMFDLASEKARELKDSGVKIRLNCGDGEPSLIPLNRHFQQFLNTIGIPCECFVGHGPHDWELWRDEIGNSLRFHSASLRA